MNTTDAGCVTRNDVPRTPGVPGPAPLDDRTEIRWAHMDGAEVVIKAAVGAGRSRLRREAEVLQRIPEGIAVAFVELVEAADHTELVTARHGSCTFTDMGLLDRSERSSALESLCETLDALHEAGWVHGSLSASHVLVEPGGTVRFTSMADSTEPGPSSTTDAFAEDNAELATLVLDALEVPPGFARGPQRLRTQWAARRAIKRLRRARGLRNGEATVSVLQRCGVLGVTAARPRRGTADSSVVRRTGPTTTTATTTSAAATTASVTTGSATTGSARTIGPATTTTAAPAGTTGAETSDPVPGEGDEARARPMRSARPIRSARRSRPAQPTRAIRTTRSAWPTRWVATGTLLCLAAGALVAQLLAGDGPSAPQACNLELPGASPACGDASVRGNLIEVGELTYEIGSPEDQVLLGDWNCDGTGTALLLEPDSGRLFHFERWSTAGTQVHGELAGSFQGATALLAGETCGSPRVRLADGSLIEPLDRTITDEGPDVTDDEDDGP